MVNKRFSAFSRKSLLVRSVLILLAGCVLLYYIYLKTTIVHQQIFIIDHQSKYSNGSINGNEETIATGTFGDHNLSAKNGNVSSSNEKGLCPLVSPHLRGEFKPTHVIPESISNVEDELKMVEALPALGGSWQPNNCTARHHIAIIVPCHDRDEHLRALLRHLHPFLQRQQNSYGIFVVDQKEDGRPFNKAMIMNAGFAEVNKTGQFSCFIFHDVDLLPEDDRNLYSCADQPRHIGIAVDKLGYHLPYNTLIGGVVAFTKSQFERINGFSNLYWGWGGEDDDAAKRIMAANMKITRWPKYARYTMLVHKRRHINPQRFHNDYASKYVFGAYRHLTSGEVSTALRPFYFTVHPDLFGQFPSERAINENSLQVLSSFLEGLQQNRYTRPTTVKFFLKPQKTVDRVTLKSVQINLVPQDVRKTVITILSSCNLPTTYVDKITPQPPPPPQKKDLDFREKVKKHYGDYEYNTHTSTRVKMEEIKKAKEAETLMAWLEGGVAETARANTLANRPVVADIERLRHQLTDRLGLTDITWDCGWNVAHFRGCLLSFNALVEQHADSVEHLKGRRLVFGNDTGVTLDGQIFLNRGEVRHNWLDFIKNVWKDDIVLQSVPAFEKAVSQVLREIKVARRKFQPTTMAKQYEINLRRLTTALIDYQGRRGYPKQWPQSLSQFKIVVESEAGPLMVSPTGQFIVPSSCPAFLLVNFITDNMKQAADLLQQYKSHKYIEVELQRQCKSAFKLADLRKDDNITPTLMIKCCDQLLTRKEQLRPLLQGSYLYITNYYSVMSDGQICIPWNFRF